MTLIRAALLACALASACTYNNTTYNQSSAPDASSAHDDAPVTDDAPTGADGATADAPIVVTADAAAGDAATVADAAPGLDATPDAAPTGDSTSCGHPLPTTAPATLTFSGAVYDPSTVTGLAGASVSIYVRGAGTPLGTAVTDAQGAYTMTVATGGAPIDGYLRASMIGDVVTLVYPAVPFAADVQLPLPVIGHSQFLSTGGTGQVAQDPHKAYFLASVIDCAGQDLAGATLTVSPAGTATVSYPDSGTSGIFLTSTSSDGFAIANNVAPGTVLVDGTAGASSLRGHLIEARVDELTIVQVSP